MDDASDDDLADGDWMSISSDEGKAKIIQITEAATKKGEKKTKKESKLSREDLKSLRQENGKLSRSCKKYQEKLEPLLKLCNKASKSCHATEAFKNEMNAAKDVLKDCKKVQEQHKNKTEETLTFDHDGHIVELMASLEKHLKCIETLKTLTDGGMDTAEIENLMKAAKEKKNRHEDSRDVD